MDYHQIITIDSTGKPCVRGLPISVQNVLDYLAAGMGEEEILMDFPELTREDVEACEPEAAAGERISFVEHLVACEHFELKLERLWKVQRVVPPQPAFLSAEL